jgi:hypothetical protein
MTSWGFAFALYQSVALLVAVWMGYRISRCEPIVPKREPKHSPEMVFKTEELEAEYEETASEETTSPGMAALKTRYEQTRGAAIDNGMEEVG